MQETRGEDGTRKRAKLGCSKERSHTGTNPRAGREIGGSSWIADYL